MSARRRKAQRVVAVVSATLVALACGTNYSYSAWAPQFAEKLKLSSTESNLIGGAGNLGMYACGIPVGLLVDAKGPLPGVLLGAVSLAIGYFPIYKAYEGGPGSMPMPFLLFFSFISGLGGCSAFSGAIKAAAMNYPNHRGTATSFPLAAFGLSAFFFSTISTIAFRGDTGKFLLLLALGTTLLVVVSSFFIRIVPPVGKYSSLPSRAPILNGAHESRTSLRLCETSEIGTHHRRSNSIHSREFSATAIASPSDAGFPKTDPDETSSLVSKSAEASIISDNDDDDVLEEEPISHLAAGSPNADIRGLSLLQCPEFWQLFMMMGLLAGIGLMTINNIGNDVKALWKYYDDSAQPEFIQQQQIMHVGILSILSFIGRLLSGIGSDILIQKLHMSRLWCLVISSALFCVTQFAGTQISNPHHLVVVSCLSGLGYGFLFGVYPSLVAHMFGIKGLSQNWGAMTLAPVISGNVFNLLYGAIYDRHSMVAPSGERDCREGLGCYRSAYWVTFFSAVSGIVLSLWCIWYEKRAHARWNVGKGKQALA